MSPLAILMRQQRQSGRSNAPAPRSHGGCARDRARPRRGERRAQHIFRCIRRPRRCVCCIFIAHTSPSCIFPGGTVAKFAGQNVHKRLVTEESYKENQYDEALKRAFLGTDEDLLASQCRRRAFSP